MIAPTLRAVLVFGATLSLAVVLLVHDAGLWPISLDLGLFVLALVALDAVLCVRPSRLDIATQAPSRLFIGSEGGLTVRIGIADPARRLVLDILAEQRGDLAPPEPGLLVVEAGQAGATTLPIRPHRRGQIAVDALWLRWRGPLGLAARTYRQPLTVVVDVVPDIRGIASAGIRFFSRDAIDGLKVQNQKGEGTEFEALREHAPGQDNRFIDWKRSAKHLKLLSKEFQVERNHQIMLAFDTGYLMAEPVDGLSRLDHAIHAGLLLGWVSLRSGDYVGSFGFDARIRQYMQPSRGMSSFARLQNASGQLGYQAQESNFTLGLAELNARLKRRALVVLFTEFVDTTTAELLLESLQRMSNRHAVIFVTLRDPLLPGIVEARPERFQAVAEAVVAHDLLRERAVVLERLTRMGVHCLETAPRGLAVGLVNRYLTIKQGAAIDPLAPSPVAPPAPVATIVLRSAEFRKSREAAWRTLEGLVARVEKKGIARLSAEELQQLPLLYRTTASSLSVARAIALDRNLILYLEGLVLRAFFIVYGPRAGILESFLAFLRRGFPAAVRKAGWHILLATLALAAGVVIGFMLVAGNEAWFGSLVPPSLAGGAGPASTAQQLRDTEIFAPWPGFVEAFVVFANFLFRHNATIGIMTFGLGILGGVPTLLLLGYQGVVLGAFFALHYNRALLYDFVGWVSIHGVTEIGALLLCGAGGLVIAEKILFPGRHSRLDSLALAGRAAAGLAGGAVLMLFVAGLIEGGLRQLIASTPWRLAIGGATGLLWAAYFLSNRGREGHGPAA